MESGGRTGILSFWGRGHLVLLWFLGENFGILGNLNNVFNLWGKDDFIVQRETKI